MRERLQLSEIKEWQGNPRTITANRFEALKKSIEDDPELMDANPIFVRKDTMTVYSGHMRLKAVSELGWKDVMCEVSDIDGMKANERAIKLNSHAGEWNNDELATLLDEMEKDGTDLSLLGLDESIQNILAGMPDFQPASIEEQGKLDEKKPITCPNCQHEFTT